VRFASHLLALFSAAPLALGLTALAGGVVLAEHHRAEAFLSPRLGEIARFLPGPNPGDARLPAVTVDAARLEGEGLAARAATPCRFESASLLHLPGSLMVIGVEPGGERLQVRWAGGPTAAADEDCGTDRPLGMDRYGFITLRNLADFGVPVLPSPTLP